MVDGCDEAQTVTNDKEASKTKTSSITLMNHNIYKAFYSSKSETEANVQQSHDVSINERGGLA